MPERYYKNVFEIIITVFMLISSCNTVTNQNLSTIKVKGLIKGYKPEKIYLANAFQWDQLLDSAKVSNGYFEFVIDSTEKSLLSQTSLEYLTIDGQIKKFEFKNDVLSNSTTNYFLDSFIPDTEVVTISGDVNISPYLSVKAGNETKALYATQMDDFGFLNGDDKNRKERYDLFIQRIKSFPSSVYLLNRINANRSLYNKTELLHILQTFNPDMKKSKTGTILFSYAMKKSDEQKKYQNFVFANEKGNSRFMYDSTKDLNMVVVWASWCGPCLAEIPDIKEVFEKYHNKGLNVVSISIDEDKHSWEKALSIEKMNWPQLIVDSFRRQSFHSAIDFDNIPLVLFLDKKGKELKRFVGYSTQSKFNYEKTIEDYLPDK